MLKLLSRLFIGLCFALPFSLLTGAIVHADLRVQEAEVPNCQACHPSIQTTWETSAHGLALSDPVFVEAWEEQGKPGSCLACHVSGYDEATGTWIQDGVACIACHSPIPSNHPNQVMPTDVSSRICGDCHIDTFAEWENSTHGQDGLTCLRCHSPHSTSLRAGDVQELCQACHDTEVHFYSFTSHSEQGLLCVDCLLRVSEGQMGEGHGQRVHTFDVDLDTCNDCHAEAMHYPVTSGSAEADPPLQAGVIILPEETLLNRDPSPVNPLGFAVVAGLVGMGLGLIVAPWLERWYRNLRIEAN